MERGKSHLYPSHTVIAELQVWRGSIAPHARGKKGTTKEGSREEEKKKRKRRGA
jgi:hypothetical protein